MNEASHSCAELHFGQTTFELQKHNMIQTSKHKQRCRRHATKIKLRGKFGQEDDRHTSKTGLALRERAPGIFSGEKICYKLNSAIPP